MLDEVDCVITLSRVERCLLGRWKWKASHRCDLEEARRELSKMGG